MAHLIFFDGECAMCHSALRFVAARSREFCFAPLAGETAKAHLKAPIETDSMILLEDYGGSNQHELRYGKGALRICWHLGGWWRFLGLFSFLPGWLANPFYRMIAQRRHLFPGKKGIEELGERLLP